jgi:hypothetical protein
MKAIKKAQNGSTKELLSPVKGSAFKLKQLQDKKSKLDSLQKAINSENTAKPLKKLEPNSAKNGGSIKAKDGKWMQKVSASIKKRGTAGKCTPITKPGCTGKAKALAKTFKKIAAKRKSK